MYVTEIFRSIQGESTFAGKPCTFVRLTGCNLRCQWCDTAYAFKGGREMSIDDILAEIIRFPLDLIEITGGEPLRQADTPLLCRAIAQKGASVLVETNGSFDISVLPEGVIRIVDVKCPSSGESESFDVDNLNRLKPYDQMKFVIADRSDFDWAVDFAQRSALFEREVLFAPVFTRLQPKQLAEWILESGLPARLQLQLHRLIWEPSRRGV